MKRLDYNPLGSQVHSISFAKMQESVFSSTLEELRVNVSSLKDCIHLLDDRFSQLRRLDVQTRSSTYVNLSNSQVDLAEDLQVRMISSFFISTKP